VEELTSSVISNLSLVGRPTIPEVPAASLAERYRLVAPLDRRATAEQARSWVALDRSSQQAVALRLLPLAELETGAFRSALRALRGLPGQHHPGLQAFGQGEVFAYAARSWVPGVGVGDLMRPSPLRPRTAQRLLLEACRAVAGLHAGGLIHGDLEPPSFRVTPGGRLMLVGGVLQSSRAPGAGPAPRYLAPEVLGGDAPSKRSDLYSLGLVIFEILLGRPLFQRVSTSRLQELQEKLEAGLLRGDLNLPGLPGRILPLARDLLRVDPAERPDSALDVQARVASAFGLEPDARRLARRLARPLLRARVAVAGQVLGRTACLVEEGNYLAAAFAVREAAELIGRSDEPRDLPVVDLLRKLVWIAASQYDLGLEARQERSLLTNQLVRAADVLGRNVLAEQLGAFGARSLQGGQAANEEERFASPLRAEPALVEHLVAHPGDQEAALELLLASGELELEPRSTVAATQSAFLSQRGLAEAALEVRAVDLRILRDDTARVELLTELRELSRAAAAHRLARRLQASHEEAVDGIVRGRSLEEPASRAPAPSTSAAPAPASEEDDELELQDEVSFWEYLQQEVVRDPEVREVLSDFDLEDASVARSDDHPPLHEGRDARLAEARQRLRQGDLAGGRSALEQALAASGEAELGGFPELEALLRKQLWEILRHPVIEPSRVQRIAELVHLGALLENDLLARGAELTLAQDPPESHSSAALDDLLARTPNSLVLLRIRVAVAAREGDRPTVDRCSLQRAWLLLEAGDLPRAEEAFRGLAESLADATQATHGLNRLAEERQALEVDRARLEAVRSRLEAGEAPAELLPEIGALLEAHPGWQEALDLELRLLEHCAAARAWSHMTLQGALRLLALDQPDAAREALAKVLRAEPGREELLLLLACIDAGAIPDLATLSEVYVELAERNELPGVALHWLERRYQENPGLSRDEARLARLAGEAGRDPFPYLFASGGRALERGEDEEARRLLDEALRAGGRSPEVVEALVGLPGIERIYTRLELVAARTRYTDAEPGA
jgi:hypothetical protein